MENVFAFFSTFNSDTRCSVRWSSRDVAIVSFASSQVSDKLSSRPVAHEKREKI